MKRFVTCQERYYDGVKYYAIKCCSDEQANEVAMDINDYVGVFNVRINKSGRFNHKDTIIVTAENYKEYL